MIVSSGNHYIAALKGNQPSLYKEVVANFIPEDTYLEINKGHGRLEKRTISRCQTPDGIRLLIWIAVSDSSSSGASTE